MKITEWYNKQKTEVGSIVNIWGTFEGNKEPGGIWVLLVSTAGNGKYWPQREISFNWLHTGGWSGLVSFVNSAPGKREILLVRITSKEAKNLYDYYYKVAAATGKWVAIEMPINPAGFEIVDKIEIDVKPKFSS